MASRALNLFWLLLATGGLLFSAACSSTSQRPTPGLTTVSTAPTGALKPELSRIVVHRPPGVLASANAFTIIDSGSVVTTDGSTAPSTNIYFKAEFIGKSGGLGLTVAMREAGVTAPNVLLADIIKLRGIDTSKARQNITAEDQKRYLESTNRPTGVRGMFTDVDLGVTVVNSKVTKTGTIVGQLGPGGSVTWDRMPGKLFLDGFTGVRPEPHLIQEGFLNTLGHLRIRVVDVFSGLVGYYYVRTYEMETKAGHTYHFVYKSLKDSFVLESEE